MIEKRFNFDYHQQNENIQAVVEHLVQFFESSTYEELQNKLKFFISLEMQVFPKSSNRRVLQPCNRWNR